MINIIYNVIEDNAGGLYLAIFNANGECVHFSGQYQYSQGQLTSIISELMSGEIGSLDELNSILTNQLLPTEDYDDIARNIKPGAYVIVADNKGIYPDKMGFAAKIEFGIGDNLVSLAEYARMHGKAYRTVRQKAELGNFRTARKIGRNWVIDSDEPYIDYRKKQSSD